jgi:putative ABC transport system permease protein
VIFVSYIAAELRRRRARTILTSLGLAVGVAMVALVVALSRGLSDAQSQVLEPLTGVGTDMSVERQVGVSGSGANESFQLGGRSLPPSEQRELRKENAVARLDMQSLLNGKAGSRFSRDWLMTKDLLSFPAAEAQTLARISGVEQVAAGLTLNYLHAAGRVPKLSELAGSGTATPTGVTLSGGAISGVDTSTPDLALVTPDRISAGRYFFSGAESRKQAIVSQSYAGQKRLKLGDSLRIRGERFTIIGIAKPPLGGETSDIYVRLGELQRISDRVGRVNVLRVRAKNADQVAALSRRIAAAFPGAQVTTARDLADRVSGSLTDAKNLSNSLGSALALVALAAAVLIATLLTLSSISKRTRELGTLKAIGWRNRLVVRQVVGESVAQGLLGGLVGALIGVAGAAVITAIGPTLKATVAQAAAASGAPIAGAGFGQGQIATGSTTVKLAAPISPTALLLAVALALVGGLVAAAAGSARAGRLRPAEALRSVE